MKTRNIFVCFSHHKENVEARNIKGFKKIQDRNWERINPVSTKTMILIKHLALKSSNCWLVYLTIYIPPIYSVLKKKKNLDWFFFSSDPVCLGSLQCLSCQAFQLPFQVSPFFLKHGAKLSLGTLTVLNFSIRLPVRNCFPKT